MRRRSPQSEAVAEAQRGLLEAVRRLPRDVVVGMIDALSPFAGEDRKSKLRARIDARLASVTVLMDAPYDPHNGAAVLRSCDAFGLQRIHVVERHTTFLAAREVARGSQRWVDVHTYSEPRPAVEELQAAGFELFATHPEGTHLPEDLRARPRVAIVLGNERVGIERDLRDACTSSVRVPMRGFVESLNVSVTAAILLHAAAQGRPGDLAEDERDRLYLRALALTLPHAPEILAARGIALA